MVVVMATMVKVWRFMAFFLLVTFTGNNEGAGLALQVFFVGGSAAGGVVAGLL